MMKWIAILAAAAVLSSCGLYEFEIKPTVGIYVEDGGAVATVTETISDTGKTTYAIDKAKPVEITFQTRPGSQGAYITGYRITRQALTTKTGTQEQVSADSPVNNSGIGVFIPSGFNCPTASNAQSCEPTAKDSTPANGVISAAIFIDTANGLTSLARDTRSGVNISYDVTFYGFSATKQPFEIKATGIDGSAQFIAAN